MENQQNTQEVKTGMEHSLGISAERNEQLVDIVINAISEFGKTEDVNRANIIAVCEKALPADMTRTELLYMGHMIQYKGEQYAQLQQMEKAKKDPAAFMEMLVDRLKQLQEGISRSICKLKEIG